MGRWKLGSNGAYYDQNDDGPDQVTPPPDQVAAMQAAGQPVAMPDSVQAMTSQQTAAGMGPTWNAGDYATANGPGSYTAQGGSYYGAGGPSSIHGGVTGYGSGGMATPWTSFDQVPAMDGSGQSQMLPVGDYAGALGNALAGARGAAGPSFAAGNPWGNAIAGAASNFGMPKQAAQYGMTGGVPGSSNQGTMAGLYQTLGPSFGRGRKPQY